MGQAKVLYTDGLTEVGRNVDDGEARLLIAARDAVSRKQQNPAKFIVERVLLHEAQHRDDVAVMTIFFE